MSTSTQPLFDAAVPGLRVALDPAALLELLPRHLPDCSNGLQLLDARVDDVQYTPGAGANVLLKLRVRGGTEGRTGRQLVCIKALRADEPPPPPPATLAEYARRRSRRGIERDTPLATGWSYIPGAHIVVQAFPLDARLPTLAAVMDPVVMRDALHQVWRARDTRVREVRAQVLSYTPEARAALRFEVLAEHRRTKLPELRRLVGKLHVSRAPARLFAGHWAVWQGAGGHAVAPPVGYVSQLQLSLQEFVTGERLSDLAGTGAFAGLLRRTAHAIANVHRLVLPVLGTRGVEKELAVVDRWTDVLARLRPSQSGRLVDLGRSLRREVAARMSISGTIHADFHMANILCDDQRLMIIDWDQAAHGDPMIDIGRVLASLRVSSLRVHGRIDAFADAGEAFLETYLRRTGEDERRARLFEAVSLLIAAAGPFRLQREGWEGSAELMLDEVERVLSLSKDARRTAVSPAAAKRQVAFPDRAAWATDRTYAQALLVPVLHQAFGGDIEVTECEPRQLATRRDTLHVRWVVKGYRAGERWRRTVEGTGAADNSGRGLLRRLELARDALAAAHPATLRLPAPLGHLEPLSMVVFEPPAGEPLEALLDTEAAGTALDRLGTALARFHSLDVDVNKERETSRTLRALRQRVARAAARAAQTAAEDTNAAAAAGLLERLLPRIARLGERRAPCVGRVRLEHIRISAEGAGVSLLDDVVMGEPLLDIGALLAALQKRHGSVEPAPAVLRLAHAYCAASGDSPGAALSCAALLLAGRGFTERPLLDAAMHLMDSA